MGFCSKCGDVIRGGAGATCRCGGSAGETLTDFNEGKDNRGDNYSNAYLSSGLSQGVDAGLKRMLGITDAATEADCADCNKRLKGDGDIIPGRDDDKPYCEGCYAKRWALGNCEKCKKYVLGLGKEWVREGRQIWHIACYDGHACPTCNSVIMGQALSALGKNYHPSCFKCSDCKCALTDSFVNRNDEPYCKTCAAKVQTTPKKVAGGASSAGSSPAKAWGSSPNVGGGSGSGTGGNNSNNSNNAQSAAAANRSANNAAVDKRRAELDALKGVNAMDINEHCTKCGVIMHTDGVKTSHGSIFHEDCFVCHVCGEGFPEGRYAEKDGKIYHSECFKKANAPVCPLCNKALVSSFLNFNGAKIHPECFKCGGCQKSLAGVPFLERDSRPYCGTCIGAMSKVVTSTGPQKGGFTVNAVSGQKESRDYGGARVGGSVTVNPGQAPGCGRCGKQVYQAEKALGPGGNAWHKACMRCKECNAALDQGTLNENNGEAYCGGCHGKLFGPKGVGFAGGKAFLRPT